MNELIEIGNDLVEYAEHDAEFTAQRGLLDELFPFIYVASKRMSLRAICRWLEDTRRIQISVNAVSKAMRNQETYWSQLVEDVEPAARTFAFAHGATPIDVLDDSNYFLSLETKTPVISAEDSDGAFKELDQSKAAAGIIRNRWFSLPEEARNQCRRHLAGIFGDFEEPKQEGETNESKQ